MQFFNTSVILNDSILKNEYRKLVRIHHPDRGGNDEMMRKLNEEYDIMKRYLVTGNMPFGYRNTEKASGFKQEEKKEKFVDNFYNRLDSRFNLFYGSNTIKDALYEVFGRHVIIDIFIHKGGREGYIVYLDRLGNRVAAILKMKVKKKSNNVDITLLGEYSVYNAAYDFARMPLEMYNKLDNIDTCDLYSYDEKDRSMVWRNKVIANGYLSTSMRQKTKKRKLNHGEKIRILNGFVTLSGEKVNTFIVVIDSDNSIKFNNKGKLFNINGWEKWNYEII